jgi:hypothetical protein
VPPCRARSSAATVRSPVAVTIGEFRLRERGLLDSTQRGERALLARLVRRVDGRGTSGRMPSRCASPSKPVIDSGKRANATATGVSA